MPVELSRYVDKRVCVIGLGYIGLPTAAVLASRGFQVRGVDVDEEEHFPPHARSQKLRRVAGMDHLDELWRSCEHRLSLGWLGLDPLFNVLSFDGGRRQPKGGNNGDKGQGDGCTFETHHQTTAILAQ